MIQPRFLASIAPVRAAALLGVVLCVSPARAQELLQHGGFEDGVAPWAGSGG